MKQIIPFKKDLLFKTTVNEITSISLEHQIMIKKEDHLSGEFHISGDYKMTEASINRESFYFKIPFDIELDNQYQVDSITVDIDNFYYEVINNESLQVNIDLYIEGEKKEKEDPPIPPLPEEKTTLEKLNLKKEEEQEKTKIEFPKIPSTSP